VIPGLIEIKKALTDGVCQGGVQLLSGDGQTAAKRLTPFSLEFGRCPNSKMNAAIRHSRIASIHHASSITKSLSSTRTVLRNTEFEPEYWVLITILLRWYPV